MWSVGIRLGASRSGTQPLDLPWMPSNPGHRFCEWPVKSSSTDARLLDDGGAASVAQLPPVQAQGLLPGK